jgi:hypothetical protein
MGRPGESAGLQTHWNGVFKIAPWSGWKHTPARSGSTAPGSQKEETKLSSLLPEGTGSPVRSARLPDHGVARDAAYLAGCHARLQSAGDLSAADTVKDEATKGGSTPTAFAGSDSALGDVATAGSQASLNSSCP